ncbi:hypothetical protein Pcinc_004581 [Petrolisthes cinctipes]|uniref:C-type lectin domain-containing protein n=2 Tax=Petrolisthes cinctipes TaxID=88211 RepID=A0AAE1GFA9_PETCI|nr:hypothetical protein Pcinc_004581 [Petrolisthes cinctipes]
MQSVVVEAEKYSLTTGKGSYTLLGWWRFCYLHSFETKQHTIYWNDKVFSGTSEGPEMVRGGGLLVIGQDQDRMGGGYTFSQSLNAVVADLRLYNRTLTNSEALDFVSCKETHLDPQPLVSFSDFKNNWKIEGSVNIEDLNLADICQKESSFLIMFPEAWSFSQAVAMCNNVGGSLPVPISARENEQILSFLNPYIPYCSDAHGYSIALGMLKEYETHSHYHYKSGENITYSNFLYRRDEDSNCVAIAVTEDDYGYWYYSKCDLELCTICNFTSVTHLKVRGLCDESLFDTTYLVLGESGEKPVFRGFSNSQLQWTGTTWTLTYLPENNVKATMTTKFEDEYPVGLRQWITEGDRCSLQQGSSQFLDGQYTCDDGTCISIDHRCDLLAHCPDLSDEINCNTVKLSETYIWELPPPLPDGSPTPVSVFVNITSVRDVSLIDLSISFDMILVFTWRDPRLTFQHLRDNMDQNPVREGVGVWHPEVFMEDGDGSSVDVQVRGRQTFVRRVGPPNPDIPTRLKEGRQSINIQIYPRTVYTMLI